jgi:hypothetical protein
VIWLFSGTQWSVFQIGYISAFAEAEAAASIIYCFILLGSRISPRVLQLGLKRSGRLVIMTFAVFIIKADF